MTSRPDLGVWIAGLSAAAVAAAIVAGLITVGSPLEARAQRLDAARLETMERIAAAAQCAYTFTDRVPASLEEIRVAFRERRTDVPACSRFASAPEAADAVSYQADGAEHIKLCADFLRPSPRSPAAIGPPDQSTDFPEFLEERAAAGRHCFRLRLVRKTPGGDTG